MDKLNSLVLKKPTIMPDFNKERVPLGFLYAEIGAVYGGTVSPEEFFKVRDRTFGFIEDSLSENVCQNFFRYLSPRDSLVRMNSPVNYCFPTKLIPTTKGVRLSLMLNASEFVSEDEILYNNFLTVLGREENVEPFLREMVETLGIPNFVADSRSHYNFRLRCWDKIGNRKGARITNQLLGEKGYTRDLSKKDAFIHYDPVIKVL